MPDSAAHITVSNHPLESGFGPTWATEWGQDECGPWAAFQIGSARQVLRWIPPGQFMMGSEAPDDDLPWTENECPQHWVRISHGFWCFDTPVTQQLWEAVLGKHEWAFPNPAHPAESVSWNECKHFIARANENVAELNLRLPSEAEWEYACRGGSDTATYGNLSSIAWYSRNAGESTQRVKRLQPNSLGLFDTLGNVWEWCQDCAFRKYESSDARDPVYFEDRAERVVRGGSWYSSAQSVRAAYRSSWLPDFRRGIIGFRCLSSPEPS